LQGTALGTPPDDLPRGSTSPSGGSWPVGVPDDDLPEPISEPPFPEDHELPPELVPEEAEPEIAPPDLPHPVQRREYDDSHQTKEGLNGLLAKQLSRKDLKPDELARFIDISSRLNGLIGKGDVDLRRLQNNELEEKWKVVSATLEGLGHRIDFGTGKRVPGRPKKNAPKTVYGSEFIGRTWAKPSTPSAASPPEVLAS